MCRGFSLIELLVAVVIAGTLGAALIVSLLIGRNTYLSSSASIDVQQEARRAFQVMVSELREGGNVTTDVARIDFQIARSFNASPPCSGICWGSDETVDDPPGAFMHYMQIGAQLIKCNSDAAAVPSTATASSANCRNWRVIGNNVAANGFSASYDAANDTVTLTLQITKISNQLPGGSMSTGPLPLRTTVKLRNP